MKLASKVCLIIVDTIYYYSNDNFFVNLVSIFKRISMHWNMYYLYTTWMLWIFEVLLIASQRVWVGFSKSMIYNQTTITIPLCNVAIHYLHYMPFFSSFLVYLWNWNNHILGEITLQYIVYKSLIFWEMKDKERRGGCRKREAKGTRFWATRIPPPTSALGKLTHILIPLGEGQM